MDLERYQEEDLLAVQAEQVNDDRLYRVWACSDSIRSGLAHLLERYQSRFGVSFEFLLYDVTNTFF